MLVGKRGVSGPSSIGHPYKKSQPSLTPPHLIATAYEIVHLIMSSISISTIFLLCALLPLLLAPPPTSPHHNYLFQWYLFAIYKAPNKTIQVAIYHHFLHDLHCKFGYVPLLLQTLPGRSLTKLDSHLYQCICKSQPERSLFRFLFFPFQSRL